MTTNVKYRNITFTDGSIYQGFVIESSQKSPQPHGYGRLITIVEKHEGTLQFEMLGYFIKGQSSGPGRFSVYSIRKDTSLTLKSRFYGYWSGASHRAGLGLLIKDRGRVVNLELYIRGTLRFRHPLHYHSHQNFCQWKPLETPECMLVDPNCSITSPGPSPRLQHTTTLLNPFPVPHRSPHVSPTSSQMFLYGGRTTTVNDLGVEVEYTLDDLWVMEVETTTWHDITHLSRLPPLYSHTCVLVDQVLYFIGGTNTQLGMVGNKFVYSFNVVTRQWNSFDGPGVPLIGHTSTPLSLNPDSSTPDSIVTVFGHHIYILSLATLTWEIRSPSYAIGCIPRSHSGHTAIAVGGYSNTGGAGNQVLIFGGELQSVKTSGLREFKMASNELRVYDAISNTWTNITSKTTPPPPNANNNMSFPPQLLSVGKPAESRHSDQEVILSDREPWNASKSIGIDYGSWTSPRIDAVAVRVSPDHMVVMGGLSSRNPDLNVIPENHLADVLVLNLRTLTWSSPWLLPLCLPRCGHSAIFHKGIVWIMGGTNTVFGETGMWEMCQLSVGSNVLDARLR